jgi:hypothetical protein
LLKEKQFKNDIPITNFIWEFPDYNLIEIPEDIQNRNEVSEFLYVID